MTNDTLVDCGKGNVPEESKYSVSQTAEDALVWLADHPVTERDAYDENQKEVEKVQIPMLKLVYESANAAWDKI